MRGCVLLCAQNIIAIGLYVLLEPLSQLEIFPHVSDVLNASLSSDLTINILSFYNFPVINLFNVKIC